MTAHEELAAWQAQAATELEPLLRALHAALAAGRPPPERLMRVLSVRAADLALPPAYGALADVLNDVMGLRLTAERLPQPLQAVAIRLATERGVALADRAAAVLPGRSELYLSPYTRLAAQVLVYDAYRDTAQAGARSGGATHKTFTRLRMAKEPREHSRLEGLTLPLDQAYIIGGIAAFGPGDPNLPWSERANCGHILRYSRRDEAPARAG